MRSFFYCLRGLVIGRTGSIATTFALLLLPLLLAVALAVDYSRLLELRGRLNDAADAAALAAVAPSTIDPTLGDAQQQAKSSSVGTAVFDARVPTDVTIASFALKLTRAGAAYTAQVDYTATFTSMFGSLLSPLSQVAGTATANYTAAYIDILVLVDTSQSMGLGADPAAQAAMAADSSVGYCAFACHGNPGEPDMVAAAHAAGYRLRIDVVKDALARVIADVRDAANRTKATIRVGLYAIDTEFRTLAAPSTDYDGLIAAAGSLDISHWGAGSSLRHGLVQLAAQIGTTGNGVSAAAPLTFAMFMSDGVADPTDNRSTGEWTYASTTYPPFTGTLCWPGQTPPPDAGPWYAPSGTPRPTPCVPDPWTSTHTGNGQMELQPLDPSWCQSVKTKGARLATLYTRYDLTPAASTASTAWATNDWRLPLMQNILLPQVATRMSNCASSASDAHVGGDKATIDKAMTSMFSAALAAGARLTR